MALIIARFGGGLVSFQWSLHLSLRLWSDFTHWRNARIIIALMGILL